MVMVFETGCRWSQLKRKCIFMYICQVFFVAEASPSVQFVTASVYVVKKKIIIQNCISPEVARSKTNSHCVVLNMDSV